MRIVILHQAVTEHSSLDERDVLMQVDAVSEALKSLGHEPTAIACDLNLSALRNTLKAMKPDAVFNLVESLDGSGRFLHLAPCLMEAMNTAFTGCPATALLTTSHKTMAKSVMANAGLPTPAWIGPCPQDSSSHMKLETQDSPGQWIIKSLWEHASAGLDETSIVTGRPWEVRSLVCERAPCLGGSAFAEAYIDGREFNLSLLQDGESAVVLPPAEILFEGYAEEKPRIVDYRAKWEEDSFEYNHTPRRFDFPTEDTALLETLRNLAIRCWHEFHLSGYARVDFRIDAQGQPWILEVNTNPCISPDAGFAAALNRAGISFESAVERILAAAFPTDSGPECKDRLPAAGKTAELPLDQILFGYEPGIEDIKQVRQLVSSTGFFYPAEVDVAVELIQERLDKSDKSGYYFVMARYRGQLIGYGSYGPIACTVSSYDLYWMAVNPKFQGLGLGRRILTEMENRIRLSGGTRIYIETSNRQQYEGTRAFYEHCGYRIESIIEDFYAPGDGRAIYGKVLPHEPQRATPDSDL